MTRGIFGVMLPGMIDEFGVPFLTSPESALSMICVKKALLDPSAVIRFDNLK